MRRLKDTLRSSLAQDCREHFEDAAELTHDRLVDMPPAFGDFA